MGGRFPYEADLLTLWKPWGGETTSGLRVEKVSISASALGDIPGYMKEKNRNANKKENKDAKTFETFFGYRFNHLQLSQELGAGPWNMRQEDFWDAVSNEYALRETFKLVCGWVPASDKLDGGKWSKMWREIPGVIGPKLSTTQIDLIFAKAKPKVRATCCGVVCSSSGSVRLQTRVMRASASPTDLSASLVSCSVFSSFRMPPARHMRPGKRRQRRRRRRRKTKRRKRRTTKEGGGAFRCWRLATCANRLRISELTLRPRRSRSIRKLTLVYQAPSRTKAASPFAARVRALQRRTSRRL